MAEFVVNEVIAGDTFKVKEIWKQNQRIVDTVCVSGYNNPEKGELGYVEAKQKPKSLILNKKSKKAFRLTPRLGLESAN